MKLSMEDTRSIYLQIAEGIEDDILQGNINEEEQVLSTNQFAKLYQINPATAAKGINLLVDEGILYKKRGIGMFVAAGAKQVIKNKRKNSFFNDFVQKTVAEAEKLGIGIKELIAMLESYKGGQQNE